MNALVGHNSNKFDAPWLLRRAWALGVSVPGYLIPRRRYWPDIFVDTMDIWGCGVYNDLISLDRFAKHLNVGAKNGSGERFSKLLEEDREAAIEYAMNDVRITKGIYEKISGLTQPERSDQIGQKCWYYDIETGPLSDERIEEIAPEFNPHKVKTGNLGFEKAQQKIAEARDNHLDKIRSEAPLHAEYGQILAIAYIDPDGEEMCDVAEGETDEKKLVENFWLLAAKVFETG